MKITYISSKSMGNTCKCKQIFFAFFATHFFTNFTKQYHFGEIYSDVLSCLFYSRTLHHNNHTYLACISCELLWYVIAIWNWYNNNIHNVHIQILLFYYEQFQYVFLVHLKLLTNYHIWYKGITVNCLQYHGLFWWLQNINPELYNHELLNHELFNHDLFSHELFNLELLNHELFNH